MGLSMAGPELPLCSRLFHHPMLEHAPPHSPCSALTSCLTGGVLDAFGEAKEKARLFKEKGASGFNFVFPQVKLPAVSTFGIPR